MAQRLGSQRQNPPASGPDDVFNKPSSQAGLMQSIYSDRADGTTATLDVFLRARLHF
jgi:hypothetical protein